MSWQSEIRAKKTAGANFDVTTDQIISFLEDWSAQSTFSVSDVASDGLTIEFSALPDDVNALASAIYELCPDTVDQGFGVIHEGIEMFEEEGEEPPPHIQELVEGLDLDDPEYGVVAMARSIQRDRKIKLWWD